MCKKKKCKHCQNEFTPDYRVKDCQKYCNNPDCQRSRKSRWEREKRQTDKDYYKRQKQSQSNWRKKKPSHQYQNEYRKAHPDYIKTNREKQRLRNKKRQVQMTAEKIVKMDEFDSTLQRNSSKYIINMNLARGVKKIVKMDEIMIELLVRECNTLRDTIKTE